MRKDLRVTLRLWTRVNAMFGSTLGHGLFFFEEF
jgi:hypothetical protein